MIGSSWQLANRERWTERAECQSYDGDVFFVDPRSAAVAFAKRICSQCPVIQECLEYAFRTDQRYGVFGGLTETERYRMVKNGRFVAPVASEGQESTPGSEYCTAQMARTRSRR